MTPLQENIVQWNRTKNWCAVGNSVSHGLLTAECHDASGLNLICFAMHQPGVSV